MSKQKSLIITDADEQLDSEDLNLDLDLNPFSFREFLRWKNQDQDPEQDLDQEQTGSKRSLDVEVRTCFFSEPSLAPQEEEEAGCGRSFQSGVDSTSSLCTEEEEEETSFSSRPEVQQGAGAAGGENYEGDDETSIAEAVTSCRRSSSRSSQVQIQQLKEENMSLRRSIMELQKRSDANKHRVGELSEELVQRRRQEEKEAQDLESMVHSVEQNLQLMTKRAVRAEGCVCRLKVDLQQLQVEVDALQSENISLKAAESEIVMTMRHNAQVASEYLNKTASHAHSSIRQLLGEAENLCLVSQLLQSIDKISNLDSES
ncbi:endosome-associated-trafficking regulator 1 isoform X2 [Anarrhichthys ocellatus]|uniref:endosome-associated-trafficking regulator 1 isoform X2 n=1 Tax=Anarrhichthys ocellatus TaxID=433405 RepID=UPI0012ED6584|nr:endosome-associated-trafficking regulator 1 isoform X2 [Anarrhichthys ocellatus]